MLPAFGTLLAVTVPAGTQDPTARTEVTRAQPGVLMHVWT